MKVIKDQIKIANEILKRLCENEFINDDELYSKFNDKDDINYIIKFLEQNNLLNAAWFSSGDVAMFNSSDFTCNAVKNNILENEYNKQKQKEEKENFEIELAKSNIEANKLNTEIAKKNEKNKRANDIATWINVSVGLINLGIIIWQLMKAV